MSYFKNRETLVAFVSDQVMSSRADLPLTMIIGRDKSGDYYAHSVIYESLENIEEIPSKLSTTTSPKNTPDG